MRWTPQQFEDYSVKLMARVGKLKAEAEEADRGLESRLLGRIVRWAKDHGYPCQANRTTAKAKTLLTPGWPDVCLILKGRVLWIELKGGKGRLSEEQKRLKVAFMALGHQIHEVRSYRAFLDLVT